MTTLSLICWPGSPVTPQRLGRSLLSPAAPFVSSLLLFLGAWSLSVPEARAAAGSPALAASPVIDSGRYATAIEARAAWRPMGDTAPVSTLAVNGVEALRFPCNFSGTRIERASWDRKLPLDLSACRGIEFKLLCPDASPVSYFSIYFQSGAGWYHATFHPESTNEWNTIVLDKAVFGTEGNPAGWSHITTIRLSAWRAQAQDTEFSLRDMRLAGALGADAQVAILRADSVSRTAPDEARSVTQFLETTAQLLQESGLGCAVLSDADVTAEQLQPASVVILPHNPRLPEKAAEALIRYVRNGGKLLVFYTVPDPLRGVLGVQPGRHVKEPRPGYFAAIQPRKGVLAGAPPVTAQHSWNIQEFRPAPGAGRVLADWLDDKGQTNGHAAIIGSSNGMVMTHVLLAEDSGNKARLLLAMAGQLAPGLWRQASRSALDGLGAIGKTREFAQVAARIEPLLADNPRARAAFESASRLRDQARLLVEASNHLAAIERAAEARQRLLEAWCLAQPSTPGEFRAFWCHSAFGVKDMPWEEAIQRLADNGFTAILPNMLWGGVAYYDSKVLPVAAEVAKRGDQIAACLAAAHRRGIQVHVWKVNWNLAHNAPETFVDRLRREHRLQFSSAGREEPWLCPSHPDNQKLEIDSMLEVARNYDVDGVHFDYIRYPDSDHCYCAGCRERFQQSAKVSLKRWPADVLAEGPFRAPWLEWRRTNITTVVRAVSEQAHALKPRLKISAAVFRNWPSDRDSIGQDWKLWCDRGWLDFVCPMDYTASLGQFDNTVGRQVQWTGRTPCYPGIGESASSSRLGVDDVIEQILVTRRYQTGGFVIFNYGVPEARELLPMLGLGITSRR